MNCTVTIKITEKGNPDIHDIEIETEGIEVDDLPNMFNYLTPKITMRDRCNLKVVK